MQYVHADHKIVPFDDRRQSICFFLQELDNITLDGQKNQSSKIRTMVNDAARMFSTETNMRISDIPCTDPRVNMIRSAEYNSSFIDAVVFSYPEHEVLSYKQMFFNTKNNHPFSSTTDCHTLTQDPNLRYIANHEFGHFAGLYHIPEDEDQRNDFMSRDCNRAYAYLPQKYIKEINS